MHAVGGHDRQQCVVQVAAVEREIGRAVTGLHRRPKGMIVAYRPGHAVAVERGYRQERELPKPVLEAEPAMYAHGIGTLLNAGADSGESLRLLVDFHRDATLAQRC